MTPPAAPSFLAPSSPAPPLAAAALDLDVVLPRLGAIVARRLGGDGALEVVERFSGNVNGILKLRYQGRFLGARLALNTYRFKYERGIVKEVFAAFLLTHAQDAGNDDVARGIVQGMLRAPVGGHVGHHLVRRILHYDWSMANLPWPFFLFEWIDGEILWQRPDTETYAAAGRLLATLHRIGFSAFYEDIFAIGQTPLSGAERFRRAWAAELAAARPFLPPPLLARLERWTPEGLDGALPCLVHNDFTGANLIREPGGALRLVDWDNWVVEAPELDLVKMKYWTLPGPGGTLAPDPKRYAAVREGYCAAARQAINEKRQESYERLWLVRACAFEGARESSRETSTGGTALAALYPGAEVYADWLGAL